MEAGQEPSDGKVSLFTDEFVNSSLRKSESLTLSLASLYIVCGERLLVW